MSDEVELRVESGRLEGWRSIEITRSIETIANGFVLEMSERAPDDPLSRPINRGDACEVWIGDDRILAGYVWSPRTSYGNESHDVSVAGWDATADLVACSALRSPRTPAPLEEIVAELVEPFGISVSVEVDTGRDFASLNSEPGEDVFAIIDRLARMRGVLLVSDGVGGLLITLPGLSRASTRLVKGENIQTGAGQFDDAERFSEITVEAQRSAGWAGDPAGAPMRVTVTDPTARRYRPMVLILDEPPDDFAALKARAQRELNLSAARGSRVTYTVKDWREKGSEGDLWAPGKLVPVVDPYLGIDRELLLTSATFRLEANVGRSTTLNLMRPEAFDLREITKPPEPVQEFWETSE